MKYKVGDYVMRPLLKPPYDGSIVDATEYVLDLIIEEIPEDEYEFDDPRPLFRLAGTGGVSWIVDWFQEVEDQFTAWIEDVRAVHDQESR
jgi:hypothetical protein